MTEVEIECPTAAFVVFFVIVDVKSSCINIIMTGEIPHQSIKLILHMKCPSDYICIR